MFEQAVTEANFGVERITNQQQKRADVCRTAHVTWIQFSLKPSSGLMICE
jgi:hypothetical protein